MPRSSRSYSVRTNILLIVLAGAIVPLALAGVWVTLSGARSGEELLSDHLVASITQFAGAIDTRWQYRQGDLLLLAENEVGVRLLSGGKLTAIDSQYLNRLYASVRPFIRSVEYRDAGDALRWSGADLSAQRPASPGPAGSGPAASAAAANVASGSPSVAIRLPVRGPGGANAGQVVATIELSAMVPPD